MIKEVPKQVIEAYTRQLGEVQEAAIRLRNQKRLTPADLIRFATMMDIEFKGPVEEWSCGPMQLFNYFLAQRSY